MTWLERPRLTVCGGGAARYRSGARRLRKLGRSDAGDDFTGGLHRRHLRGATP